MRRVSSMVIAASGVTGLGLGLAMLGPGPDAAVAWAAGAAPGRKVCTVTDDRMVGLSGLVATAGGYVVVNDGNEADRTRIFLLNEKCKLKTAVAFSGNGPWDPEDLAVAPDGRLWIADIGDNVDSADRRSSVALWRMPIDGSTRPVLHRLAYPDGKPHDAEALLIGADGAPLIITKAPGRAEIYRPTGALRANNASGVPMEKVGEVTVPKSTTANRLGPPGRMTITGAARSPDGKRVVLRTYADAFEWDVPDGDIVKALTTGQPRATPLADVFGEAISYTVDGTGFVTVSDVESVREDDPDIKVEILGYTPTEKVAAVVAAPEDSKPEKSWTDELTLDDVTYLIAAIGILGVALVGLGIFGIVRARRRPDGGAGAGDRGPDDNDGGPAAGRRAVSGSAGPRGRDRVDDPAPRGGYHHGGRGEPLPNDDSAGGRGHPGGVPSRGGEGGPDRRSRGGVYGGQSAAGTSSGVYGAGRPPGGPLQGGAGGPSAGNGFYGSGAAAADRWSDRS